MRGKQYFVVLVISFIFLFGLTLAITPLIAQPGPWVKVYVDYSGSTTIPFQSVGTKFGFNVMIETHGFTDGLGGMYEIIAWGMDIRVDPSVLNVDLVAPPPPPFPPPPPPASVVQGNFLATYAGWYGLTANLLSGTTDPTTGYWDDIAEALMPTPAHGAGDYVSSTYPILVTVQMTSKSTTQPCLIDLIDVEWRSPNGNWYPVDVVVDGFYGEKEHSPTYLSNTAAFDPTDPVGSPWHELYPYYCNNLVMTSHTDNGDGVLSASDQVDFSNETDPGYTYWYHVDAVTVTIHWTFKIDETTPTDPAELGDGEPYEPNRVDVVENSIPDPIGTAWHQIYPDYCREFVITSHVDTDGDGALDPSEQFDFEYLDEEGVVYWAHLDSITTDLILSFKEKIPDVPEFPLGIGLILAIVPMVPVIYLWRKREA